MKIQNLRIGARLALLAGFLLVMTVAVGLEGMHADVPAEDVVIEKAEEV